jgi:monoamine oxidase
MSAHELTSTSAPALIVGGGLAGLYAAYCLEKAKIPYVLWEAQPRWGGRILSLPVESNAHMGVDLGPTWFWPHQQRIQLLCTELGLPHFEQPVTGDVMYQLTPRQAPQRTPEVDAMVSYRLEGGMQALISALVKRLAPQALKLNHALISLARSGDVWAATANHLDQTQHIEFRQLIVAAPPRKVAGILRPHLSTRLYAELNATPTWMAAQAKFVAIYDTPFWRQDALSGQAFSRVGPMVEIHDASSSLQAGHALFGFLGVPAHIRGQHGQAALEAACLSQLTAIFGPAASQPRAILLKDWAQDAWIVSQQDLSETPQHPDLNLAPWSTELSRLELYLVGSECAPDEAGYLEGALCAVDTFLDWGVSPFAHAKKVAWPEGI